MIDLLRRIQDPLAGATGPLALGLAGFLLAVLLGFLLTRFVAGVIRRLSQNTRYGTIFDSPALASLPRLAGSAVFWLTLLAVPSAVLERLDLNVPSELLDGLSEFLPNIFVAVLVLVLGIVGGRVARQTATSALSTAVSREPT